MLLACLVGILKNKMTTEQLEFEEYNPGSKEAVDRGCTCPVIDNHNGKGLGNGMFWISAECPLHGVEGE